MLTGMRTSLLATVAALMLAGPAHAATAPVPAGDDPGAVFTSSSAPGVLAASCTTPDKPGVAGQYGAWGSYIAGCTVRLTCPSTVHGCTATNHSSIATAAPRGRRVTLNARTRVFDGSVVAWYRDVSCAGVDTCAVDDGAIGVGRGQATTVQCNGVRQTVIFEAAHVTCTIRLTYR
jgi:hypothetical protein